MVKTFAYLLSAVVATASIEEVDHTGLLQTTKHRSNSRSVASRTHSGWSTDDFECKEWNLCCKSAFETLKAEGEREIGLVQACASRITAEIASEKQAIAGAEASKNTHLQQTAEALKATTSALARVGELESTMADARKNHEVQSEGLRAEYEKLEDDFNAVRRTALRVAAFIHEPDLCDAAGQQYESGTNLIQGKWGWSPISFKSIGRSITKVWGDTVDAVSDAVDDGIEWTCKEGINKHTSKVCHSTVQDQRDQYAKDLAAAQATLTKLKSELKNQQTELTASLAQTESANQDKEKQIAARNAAQAHGDQLQKDLDALRVNNENAIKKLASEIKRMEDTVSAFKSSFSENLFKEMRTLDATD